MLLSSSSSSRSVARSLLWAHCRRGASSSTISSRTTARIFFGGDSMQQQQQLQPSVRSFSTNLLDTLLQREYDEDKETGADVMPDALSDLKKKLENWKIVDDASVVHMHGTTTSGGQKVHVSFHCQDTVQPAEDDDVEEEFFNEEEPPEAELAEEEEEDDEEDAPIVRFTATHSKAGTTMVWHLVSKNGEVQIEGVSTTTSNTTEDTIHATQGTLPKDAYQGPEFLELAEDVQDAMADFVHEELGINEDVAAFVAMYADYREQLEYMKFLMDAKKVVG